MKVDLQMVYLVLVALGFMGGLAVFTIKKILSARGKFTTFLMVIEELIGATTLGYLVSLAYKAMENYDIFVAEYGNLADKFTNISIYFCASQIILLILVGIYKFINKSRRLIKKRRIIK